jgi:integrase
MKALLTQALLEKARRARQRTEIWDTNVSNFYLQVRESGVASFYIRYLQPGTNTRRSLLIGDGAVLSVIDARAKAKKLLGQVAFGEDPGHQKKQLKDCPTLEEVVNNYYLPYKAKKTSCRNDAAIFRIHVLPYIGKKKLHAITPGELADLQRRVLERGCVPATANRPVVLTKHLFNLSMKIWHLPGVTSNPANEIPLLKENSMRQTFLSEAQALQLMAACKEQTNCPMLWSIVAFLLLTGARRRNVLDARWCEIDEHAAQWNIPRTKSGRSQSIPLSDQAMALLRSLETRGRSEYLFPSPKTGLPFINIYNRWHAARVRVGMAHVRMHDLRHTFASLLINAGCSLFVVQKALGHHSPRMTMRYAHLADKELQDAAKKVGKLMEPGLTGLSAKL